MVNMLHYINNTVWKTLFGKQADGIEQSVDDEDEYRIIDTNPVTNMFISATQQDEGRAGGGSDQFGPNCANFIAGIIEGVLCSNQMPCQCSALFVPDEDEAGAEGDSPYGSVHNPYKKSMTTLYVIKFDREVLAREQNETAD